MRTILMVAAALGGLGVLAGAFGAHALKDRLTPDDLAIYTTAVHYQQVHALALFGVALGLEVFHDAKARRWLGRAAVAFGVGVAAFSGSLYCLVLSGVRLWGALTPFGGLALLAGWACLLLAARNPALKV